MAVIEYHDHFRVFGTDGTYTVVPFDPYYDDYPYNEASKEAVHDKVWTQISRFRRNT